MTNWDKILDAAEQVKVLLLHYKVNHSEAEKVGDYFSDHAYKEEAIRHYLKVLADNPPVRSRRSAPDYRNIRRIWSEWRTELAGQDKARAWGWGVRLAKIKD